MAHDRGNGKSFTERLGLKGLFGLAADGYDMQQGTAELEQNQAAENTPEQDKPHYNAKIEVIRTEDVTKAGDTVCELNDRCYALNIAMQTSALNADNPALAEEIGELWQGLTNSIDKLGIFEGEAGFAQGLKNAAVAYHDFVYDAGALINLDLNAAIEMRTDPEKTQAQARARAGVHFLAEGELGDLANKVGTDLAMANKREVAPVQQMNLGFG